MYEQRKCEIALISQNPVQKGITVATLFEIFMFVVAHSTRPLLQQ